MCASWIPTRGSVAVTVWSAPDQLLDRSPSAIPYNDGARPPRRRNSSVRRRCYQCCTHSTHLSPAVTRRHRLTELYSATSTQLFGCASTRYMKPPLEYSAFISYASDNREKAEAICASLEQRGRVCWIAPRDIRAGREYGDEI